MLLLLARPSHTPSRRWVSFANTGRVTLLPPPLPESRSYYQIRTFSFRTSLAGKVSLLLSLLPPSLGRVLSLRGCRECAKNVRSDGVKINFDATVPSPHSSLLPPPVLKSYLFSPFPSPLLSAIRPPAPVRVREARQAVGRPYSVAAECHNSEMHSVHSGYTFTLPPPSVPPTPTPMWWNVKSAGPV